MTDQLRGRSGAECGRRATSLGKALRSAAIIAVVASSGGILARLPGDAATSSVATARPNILWVTTEDMSPDLHCFGNAAVKSPHLDALAAQGQKFSRAFSSAPVCSASRSSIITGMYATTLGTQNHRSHVDLPEGIRCFTAYLREAGYYCTNNSKTDYNFNVPADAWDENSKTAHWRNRPRPDQPFFSVFNFLTTHESKFQINEKAFARVTSDLRPQDRATTEAVKLPPYIPDTAITRHDWARYYDMIAEMDIQAGRLLDELEKDGLATNTIVMFYSDHGVGLPRGKRWLYDSGTRVPLIVRWPGHIKPGSESGELVSLLDLAPTVLSLAGLPSPATLQGRTFMGPEKQPEPQYLFQTRDRMDETYDAMRSVRGRQFRYIKNFYPEKPYDLVVKYAEKTPTLQELRRLHGEGKLVWPQTWFFQKRKPAEELYDTKADPWEIRNLAADPAYASQLGSMRRALELWELTTNDKGLHPDQNSFHQPEKQKKRKAKRQDD